MEKLLVTSNFSFSHSVFKRLVSQGCQKVSLCGNGLKRYNKITNLSLQTQGLEVWLKPLMGSKFMKGSIAIAVLNNLNYGTPLLFSATLKELTLSEPLGYHITEAFQGDVMGKFALTDTLSFHVNPTGIYIVTAVPI